MDGWGSSRSPLCAAAFASLSSGESLVVGMAASVGAGVLIGNA
jgi:hypothetical protein